MTADQPKKGRDLNLEIAQRRTSRDRTPSIDDLRYAMVIHGDDWLGRLIAEAGALSQNWRIAGLLAGARYLVNTDHPTRHDLKAAVQAATKSLN